MSAVAASTDKRIPIPRRRRAPRSPILATCSVVVIYLLPQDAKTRRGSAALGKRARAARAWVRALAHSPRDKYDAASRIWIR